MYNKQITISFTEELHKEYLDNYFKLHSRAKNNPLLCDTPLISLNKWVCLSRMAYNKLKDEWTNYVMWVIDKYGYKDLEITECNVIINITYPTKRAFDLMNFTSDKFILDAFTKSRLIADDNVKVIQYLGITGRYEKGISRLDYIIKY